MGGGAALGMGGEAALGMGGVEETTEADLGMPVMEPMAATRVVPTAMVVGGGSAGGRGRARCAASGSMRQDRFAS